MPDRVVLEHELAGERRVGVERHRRRAIELLVAERADRRGGRRAVRAGADRAPPAFVTASFSAACPAFIALTSSIVTPAIGLPPASVCASWISSGYTLATWCTTTPILRPSPGSAGLPLRVGERARERGERARALFEAIGERVRARPDDAGATLLARPRIRAI